MAGALASLAAACDAGPPSPRVRPHARPYDAPPDPFETTPVGRTLPDGLDADSFAVYTRTPLTLETHRHLVGAELLTPASLLFVRNNLPLPARRIVEDPDRWRLHLVGVKRPRSFTLGELRELGETSVVSVLQCSGNGRRFFEHGPSGSQWGVGAAGCVRWTGVPCSKVLEAAGGPEPGTTFLNAAGGDPMPPLPPGINEDMIRIERSIPIDKAMDDALLAWQLGDDPIPLTHGGPLRLIVPGYYGVNNVKYVDTLTCAEAQSTARIMQTSYRLRDIGTKGAPDQPTMWRMNVKSWVSGPGGNVKVGPQRLYGVAFSGERGARSVDISLDGGETWAPARLVGDDLGRNAWRRFEHDVTLRPGKYRVCTRATDAAGDVQPATRVDNARGYGNNAWRDHGLDLEAFVTLPEHPKVDKVAVDHAPATLSAQAKRGRELFKRADPQCGNCHTKRDAGAGMTIGPNSTISRHRLRGSKTRSRTGSGSCGAIATQ